MTLFDKVLISLHRGFERLKQAAAIFSERVKFELNVIRLRVRIDTIRERITELHAQIGRKAAGLRNGESAPDTFEEFLRDDEITAALDEIEKLTRDIDEITADIAREREESVTAAAETEERKT